MLDHVDADRELATGTIIPRVGVPQRVRQRREEHRALDPIVKSATRALEVIELFAVCREALAVSAVADALGIPRSSASILLKAMNRAGFIERDARTRKYTPSLRSALSAQRVGAHFLAHPDLLAALDRVSNRTGCDVRLGVRRGIHVQYAHLSWPEGAEANRLWLRPGVLRSICHDPLGTVLLAAESDNAVSATIRHANAVAGPDLDLVRPADYLVRLRRCRELGFCEEDEIGEGSARVLAIRLATPSGAPAAIGIAASTQTLELERGVLLQVLSEEIGALRLRAPVLAN